MRKIVVKIVFFTLVMCAMAAQPVLAAVGCDLNNADRDLPRLFPDSTKYNTIYVSISQRGGAPLLRKIENRLGAMNLALYAPIGVQL